MRKAFYAGAAVTFELLDIATAQPEEGATRIMVHMHEEIQRFAASLAKDLYVGKTFDWTTKQ